MNKIERFKLYELSLLEGNTKFKYLNKSINEFLSDNFENDPYRKNYNFKFPISKKKIHLSKKKQYNLNKEEIRKNPEILDKIKKNFHYKKKLFHNMGNKSQMEIKSNTNRSNNNSSKFKKINSDEESNTNNLDLQSIEISQDLNLTSQKININKNPNYIRLKSNLKKPRVQSSFLPLHKKIKNNIKSFSLKDFVTSRIKNIDKKYVKFSEQHSPSSTMVKSLNKNVSFKSDINDSQTVEKSRNKIQRIKSAFSLKSEDRYINKDNNSVLDDDIIIPQKYYSFRERRTIKQKIKLKSLLYQIELAEKKNIFNYNGIDIRTNNNILKKFKRDQLMKRVKSASRKNFFANFPFQSNKFVRLNKKRKTNIIPHQNMVNDKSKKFLKNIQKFQRSLNTERRKIKSYDHNIELNNLKYFVRKMCKSKDLDKKIDEQFKKDTVNYQGKIGKFFVHKGSGIFSGHLHVILKGDKINQNLVKLENI